MRIEFDVTTGETIELPDAPSLPPLPEPVTILYPIDLWSRLTEAEAEAVEAATLASEKALRRMPKRQEMTY